MKDQPDEWVWARALYSIFDILNKVSGQPKNLNKSLSIILEKVYKKRYWNLGIRRDQ